MSARTQIQRLRTANPGAADLATLCSLAVLVEPELLRRLRLLLPGADITAESDLWSSELLSGASSRGIALDPLMADELRADLRLPRWSELRTVAWQHIADCHRSLHWSLRLEEQINRHVVDGAGPEVIEPLLLAAVGELSTAGRDGGTATQVGIARWLIGALARLPRLAAETDATAAAGLAAGLHLDGRVPTESAPVDDHWLPWLLSSVGATRVRVPVRFAGGVLEVNPASSDIVPFEAPRTQPMVLDVDWHDGRTPHSTRLTFTDTPASCPVHADEVTLTTLAGTRTRLSRTRNTPAGLDFTTQRTHHRPYFDRYGLLDRAVRVVEEVPWTLLTGVGGTGKTALACAVADRLERRGWVVAQHFYGVDQAWDDPEVVVASLDSQLRAAFPDLPRPVTSQPEPLSRSLQRIGDLSRGTRILLLIDSVPDGFTEESVRLLFGSSQTFRDVRFLITSAAPETVWIGAAGARQGIDLNKDTYDVCAAILEYHDPTLRDIWDTKPVPAELISLAGDNPGHLTRIIDWLLTQPPASATLDRIPHSLTIHMARTWRRLSKVFPRELLATWLAALAVARDNFTVDDALNLTNFETPAELLGAAVEVGLVHVDGPLDDDASIVTAEPSLAAAIVAEFGPNALLRGHILHSEAFPMRDVGSASRYQISSVMHHFAHADRMEILELPVTGEFLRRRACQDGVSAVIEDLHTARAGVLAPVRRAAERIADIAARHPDRFVELLVAELQRQGETVPAELVVGWPPALVPRWVRRPPGGPTTPQIVKPVTAAAWLAEVSWFVLIGPDGLTVHRLNGEQVSHTRHIGATSVVVHDDDIAVATDIELTLFAEDSTMLARWHTKSPITALGSVLGRLVAGTRSGVILLIDQKHRLRHLVGHGNAITAIAEIRDRLVSASLDGTVRIWDPSTGSLLRTLRHRGPVRHVLGLAVQDVVTADDTGRVHWWNPDTGEEVRRFRGHDAPVTALCDIDGATVMSAAADGTMWLWHRFDPDRDRQLADAGPAVVGALRDRFTKKSFITWDDKGRVIYWNDAGDPTRYHLAGDLQLPVRTVFPGPEGHYLAHAGGVLTIPHRPKGNPIATQCPVAVSGRDEVLLGMPNGLLIHDTESGEWRTEPTGEAVIGLAAAGNEVVLMAHADGIVIHWPSRRMWSLNPRVRLVAAGRATEIEAAIDEAGNLHEFVARRSVTRDAPLPQVPQATALAMRQVDFLVGTALGEVMLIGDEHEPIVATVPTPVIAVAVAGKQWCVIGTSDGTVYRWHPEEALLSAMGRHDGPVAGLAAAGNRFAASTSADGTVRLWDVLNGAEHAMVAGPEPFHGITFHGSERLYVRSGEEGLWCLDLLATDAARSYEELRGDPLSNRVISVRASVPFEIRAVQPLRGSRFGATEVRLWRQEGESRFVDRVGWDGRLAVPWRFSGERDVQIGVGADPCDGVRVAYVTFNRRDERWLTINFNEETQA